MKKIKGIIIREYEEKEEKAGEYRVILVKRWKKYIYANPYLQDIILNDLRIMISYLRFNSIQNYG
jgi:hypothetical protein